MYRKNPWESYRQVSFETAPPGQLVLMLYEGAIRYLETALSGFQADDPLERNQTVHNALTRVQDILHELNVTLNMEAGGEIAETLRDLYNYLINRLYESNLKKEESGVIETLERIKVLRDAWAEMLTNQGIATDRPVPTMAATVA